MPDFLGSKEVRTVSYVCLKCGKPCNAEGPNSLKRRTLATKKRTREQKKRLDFQGKILQKLVELLDGIKIHPVKGVILTPKKKRQLAEFQKIEKKLFKNTRPRP